MTLVVVALFSLTARAMPKSATRALPSRSIRMFPGFTSRWTMPWSWQLVVLGRLDPDSQRLPERKAGLGGEQPVEVGAVHELHDDVVRARFGLTRGRRS